MNKELDARGLACPKPVVMAKKALDGIEEGSITIAVDNETAVENLSRLAESVGSKPQIKKDGKVSYITIEKKKGNQACQAETAFTSDTPQGKGLLIMISSDMLGTGDEELGTLLMKNYIYSLTQADIKPATLIFVNKGVSLAISGSQSLDDLKKLEKSGTEIFACGTCLDFYGVKDKLAIGKVTNMYDIVEKMNSAANTIKI